MTDGSACPAQCENGTCTGACKNGDTQCTSSQAMQTCNNGQWGATMTCPLACVDNECGGVCSPNSTQCASGTEVETCGQTGQWGERRGCDLVCTGNKCGGQCRPNDRKCKNSTQEQLCNEQGQWQDGQTCTNVCVNNACGGVCKPGAKQCVGRSQIRECNDQGQWQTRTCPNNACVDNQCVNCVPDDVRCKSNTQFEKCNASGNWSGTTESCEFACDGNQCTGDCVPGTGGTCNEDGKPEGAICSDEGDLDNVTCKSNESCQGGKCGSFPKTLFVTSVRYLGTLGGLDGVDGADKKCSDLASNAKLTGTFKAFLLDSKTKDIRSRFKLEGGPFRLPSGKVVANNWDQLLQGSLLAPMNETEKKEPPVGAILRPTPADFCGEGQVKTLFWSNVNDSGKLVDSEAHCNDWNSNSDPNSLAHFGNFADTSKRYKGYCAMLGEFCETGAHLLCIQN
jgi:hypothetical protein